MHLIIKALRSPVVKGTVKRFSVISQTYLTIETYFPPESIHIPLIWCSVEHSLYNTDSKCFFTILTLSSCLTVWDQARWRFTGHRIREWSTFFCLPNIIFRVLGYIFTIHGTFVAMCIFLFLLCIVNIPCLILHLFGECRLFSLK